MKSPTATSERYYRKLKYFNRRKSRNSSPLCPIRDSGSPWKAFLAIRLPLGVNARKYGARSRLPRYRRGHNLIDLATRYGLLKGL